MCLAAKNFIDGRTARTAGKNAKIFLSFRPLTTSRSMALDAQTVTSNLVTV